MLERGLVMQDQRSKISDHRSAFTLIEVLVVVAIIGVAGAVIVPHMLTGGTLGVQAAARAVISDLIFAQNDAITRQTTRKVVFDAGTNSYSLTDKDDQTLYASWKAGAEGSGNFTTNFSTDDRFQGIRIENVDFGGGGQIAFDAMGAPDKGGTLDVVSGDTRYRITVAPFTGRVTVAPVTGG